MFSPSANEQWGDAETDTDCGGIDSSTMLVQSGPGWGWGEAVCPWPSMGWVLPLHPHHTDPEGGGGGGGLMTDRVYKTDPLICRTWSDGFDDDGTNDQTQKKLDQTGLYRTSEEEEGWGVGGVGFIHEGAAENQQEVTSHFVFLVHWCVSLASDVKSYWDVSSEFMTNRAQLLGRPFYVSIYPEFIDPTERHE